MGILTSIYQQKPGNIIFFDTETTDLRPGQIAQLSYVVTDAQLSVLMAKNFYFTVEQVSPGASQVNGLTVRKLVELSGGKGFDDHHEEIHRDFHQQNWVAHNVNFDIKFMETEFLRRSKRLVANNSFCTMQYFTEICCLPGTKTKYKFPKLTEVLKYYQITDEEVGDFAVGAFGDFNGSFHDSRFDVAGLYLICKRASEEEVLERIG